MYAIGSTHANLAPLVLLEATLSTPVLHDLSVYTTAVGSCLIATEGRVGLQLCPAPFRNPSTFHDSFPVYRYSTVHRTAEPVTSSVTKQMP